MDSNVQKFIFVDKFKLKGKPKWDFGGGEKLLDIKDLHDLVEALKSASSPPPSCYQFKVFFFFFLFFFSLPLLLFLFCFVFSKE